MTLHPAEAGCPRSIAAIVVFSAFYGVSETIDESAQWLIAGAAQLFAAKLAGVAVNSTATRGRSAGSVCRYSAKSRTAVIPSR